MKNKMDITIKVIQNNTMHNRRLAKYFADKYCEDMKNVLKKKS
jgi:hypothetical protein